MEGKAPQPRQRGLSAIRYELPPVGQSLLELSFPLVAFLWDGWQLPLFQDPLLSFFYLWFGSLEETHWTGHGHRVCQISSLGASLVFKWQVLNSRWLICSWWLTVPNTAFHCLQRRRIPAFCSLLALDLRFQNMPLNRWQLGIFGN